MTVQLRESSSLFGWPANKRSLSIMFLPFQDLVIDESMVLFKGRLIFKQYIRTKGHRFGTKLFVLCDCETGYVLDYIVSTGSQTKYRGAGCYRISGDNTNEAISQ